MDFVDDPKLRCETKHIWGDSPKVEISKVTIDFLFHKKKIYIAVYILLIRSLMLKRKERNDNAEKCTTSENDA